MTSDGFRSPDSSVRPRLSRGPFQDATADEVNVKMKDGLAREGADVDHGAVAIFDAALAGDLGGGKLASADDFRVFGLRFFQAGDVLLGDDENVCRPLRIEILEGEDVVIFEDLFRGDFAAKQAAEKTVNHKFRF